MNISFPLRFSPVTRESDCYCSVTESCLPLCNPVDCSMPVFPILHYISWCLLKLMSTESVMLSISSSAPPSPSALCLSQHLGLRVEQIPALLCLHQEPVVLQLPTPVSRAADL